MGRESRSPREPLLRIIYRCTRCEKLFERGVYNLRFMFGAPAICDACLKILHDAA